MPSVIGQLYQLETWKITFNQSVSSLPRPRASTILGERLEGLESGSAAQENSE